MSRSLADTARLSAALAALAAVTAALAILLCVSSMGCSRASQPAACCVDLLTELSRAEVRPINRPPGAVQVVVASHGGDARRSLSVRVPSRIIFHVRIPQGATLASALAVEAGADSPSTLGVAFRVGISDGRTYEQLLDRTVLAGDSPAWQAVELDLKRYAGWQWSLFYRPSSLAWEIVLNAYPTAPTSPDSLRALWATPQINGAGR